MVHSFAFATKGQPTDLTKVQAPAGTKIYADAGFTALAEQQPRVAVAKSHYPEMGDDKSDFLRFFGRVINIEHYNIDVDVRVAEAISTARALKVGDENVFDDILVREAKDEEELLAIGMIQFGYDTLYFPIVQWRVPKEGVNTEQHTSIEEIKALQRDIEQARKDREAAEAAEDLRKKRLWGYPLLVLALLMLAVVIYAPLAHSTGWLAIGLIGSFVACVTGMIRSAISKSIMCGIAAFIGFAGVMGVLIGLSYLMHIGVIK